MVKKIKMTIAIKPEGKSALQSMSQVEGLPMAKIVLAALRVANKHRAEWEAEIRSQTGANH
jgi:hypothetical protein